jgi:hypothetical protein
LIPSLTGHAGSRRPAAIRIELSLQHRHKLSSITQPGRFQEHCSVLAGDPERALSQPSKVG